MSLFRQQPPDLLFRSNYDRDKRKDEERGNRERERGGGRQCIKDDKEKKKKKKESDELLTRSANGHSLIRHYTHQAAGIATPPCVCV